MDLNSTIPLTYRNSSVGNRTDGIRLVINLQRERQGSILPDEFRPYAIGDQVSFYHLVINHDKFHLPVRSIGIKKFGGRFRFELDVGRTLPVPVKFPAAGDQFHRRRTQIGPGIAA